jgi:hypothetical protein
MSDAPYVDPVNGPKLARRSIGRSALAAVGVVAVMVAFAGHVSAATGALTASNFAGYGAEPGQGVVSASATFKIPTVSCSNDNSYSQELGTDFPSAVYSDVVLACNGAGIASYTVELYAADNTATDPGVSPGDTVVSSIFQTPTTDTAQIVDLTKAKEWSQQGNPFESISIAYIGGLNSSGTPPFTTTTFTKCQVDGIYLTDGSPVQYNEKSGRTTLVTAGKISKPGDTFKLTFRNET